MMWPSIMRKYFYMKGKCYKSYPKNDQPQNLKVVLDKKTGEVKHATCSCVAGLCGFCNHILALLLKVCQFSLFGAETVSEDEEDEILCTSKP